MVNKKELKNLYYKDKYHIEFLDKLAPYIDKDNLGLYMSVLDLSIKAVDSEEILESYELALKILCYRIDILKDIFSRDDI